MFSFPHQCQQFTMVQFFSGKLLGFTLERPVSSAAFIVFTGFLLHDPFRGKHAISPQSCFLNKPQF